MVFWDEDKILRVVWESNIRVKNHCFNPGRSLDRRNCQWQDSPGGWDWCFKIPKKGHRIISLSLLLDHPSPFFLLLWLFFAGILIWSAHFHGPWTYSCLRGVLHFLKTQWSEVKARPFPSLEALFNCLYWLWFCLPWPLIAIRILILSEGLRVRRYGSHLASGQHFSECFNDCHLPK